MSKFFIVPTDEMGGAEQLTKMLAIECSQKFDVEVLCLTKPSQKRGWADFKGKVHYFPTNNVFIGFFFLFFFLFNKKFDLVFSSQVYINGYLGFLRKYSVYKTNMLVVRESTSVFLRFKGKKLLSYRIFYKIGYRMADLIICQTPTMLKQLLDNLNFIDKEKAVVIANPIDLENIKDKLALEPELICSESPYIVGLGRLIPAKGFDLLIEAFSRISVDFPNHKLIILGEGGERRKLESLIKSKNIEDKVVMPGYTGNPYPYLKGAKLCVVSSRIEGFPNILLQMMAVNNNVVCTTCAGGIEDIKGIAIAQADDVNDLTKAMNFVLSNTEVNNRELFDYYLQQRSVDNFLAKIFSYAKK